MTATDSRGIALARAAESMLRALGGGQVTLRCATTPAANFNNLELWLDAPASDDVPVSPVLVRPCGAGALVRETFELLFAPSTLSAQLADRQQSPEDFLRAVLAIMHQGRTLRVCTVSTDTFAGAPYLYRVTASE